MALPLAEAATVTGTLDASSMLSLTGSASATARTPLFILTNVTDLSSLASQSTRATLDYHVASTLYTTPLAGQAVRTQTGQRTESASFDSATITAANPKGDVYIAVFPITSAPSNPYALSLSTAGQLPIQTDGASRVRSIDSAVVKEEKAASYEFTYDYDRPHLWTQPGDGTVTITGDFSLYAWSATLNVRDAQGSRAYQTGEFKTNETVATYQENEAWVVATLTNATLSFTIKEPQARIYSDAFTTTLAGTLRVDDATGQFQAGGRQYSAQGGSASLQGNLDLVLSPATSPSATTPLLSSGAPRAHIALSGDLQHTTLVGVPVGGATAFVSTPAGKATIASGIFAFFIGSIAILRRTPIMRRRVRPVRSGTASALKCYLDCVIAAVEVEDWSAALECIRAARKSRPYDAGLCSTEALYLRNLKQFEAAIGRYEEADVLGDASANIGAAICAVANEDLALAESFARRALERDPELVFDIENEPQLASLHGSAAFESARMDARGRLHIES